MDGCKYASNNQYFNAPARMADGRLFTDYRRSYDMNVRLSKDYNTSNPTSYRIFLENNGNKVRTDQENNRCEKVCTFPCMDPLKGTLLPEQTMETCGKDSCSFSVSYQNGLGLGRSNTKLNTPETFKCVQKKNNCCVPAEFGRNFYGNVPAKGEKTCSRLTLSGGNVKDAGDPVAYNMPL